MDSEVHVVEVDSGTLNRCIVKVMPRMTGWKKNPNGNELVVLFQGICT